MGFERQRTAIANAQTFLFTPGNRPERFAKARESGADVVILDLEDAVPPGAKDMARQAVAASLTPDHPVAVRINPADTAWFDDDLALCRQPGIAAIVFPKAELGPGLQQCAGIAPVIALIETATGVEQIAQIARLPHVARLGLGAVDLALDLDITGSDRMFDPIRLAMTVASRAADIAAPVEGVTTDFRNADVVAADTQHARSCGFTAKLCIHPAQITPVKTALMPSAERIALAQRICAADNAAGGAAVSLDGQMIDRPIVARAHRLLATVTGR